MKRRAYVLIQVDKGQADTVAAELNGKRGVVNVEQVFGHHDVVALIEADDIDSLAVIVRNALAEADHVVRTETLVVTSAIIHKKKK